VAAGQVTLVEAPVTPGGEVLVHMVIDGRLRYLVRADARVRIVPEGMVGGKVMEIDPGSEASPPATAGALLASEPTVELGDAVRELRAEMSSTLNEVRDGVRQASQALRELRQGEGIMGKELLQSLREVNKTVQQVRDGEGVVGSELQQSLQQFRRTLSSIKQDVDAVQQLPLVGKLVKDPLKVLIRPDCDRQRQVMSESDLFVAGSAVLTESGRVRLNAMAPWLKDQLGSRSELVVASFGDPSADADSSRLITQKQAEIVCEFLKTQHAVHKSGWFSRRNVTSLGVGAERVTIPGDDQLPRPRLEVIVFTPP
jgi:hypothetical protein